MARRNASEEPMDDLFDSDESDLSFDDLPLDDEDMNLSDEDMQIDDDVEDVDLDAVLEGEETRHSPDGALTPGQIIIGAIQVILVAVLVLVIVLALSAGAILAGQRFGLVPTRPSSQVLSLSIIGAPTSAPAQPPASNSGSAPTSTPAAGQPTVVADAACTKATDWWNSQQVQSVYQYFTAKALNDARDTSRVPALLDQMNIQRSFVANFPADACVTEARDTMLRGFDSIIAAVRAMGSNDQAAVAHQQVSADTAFAELTAALWAVNVNTDASSPPAQNITRGSGVACGGQDWLNSVQADRGEFGQFAQQIDVTNSAPTAANNLLNSMRTDRGKIDSITAPACMATPKQLLLGAMDSDIQSFTLRLGGNPDNALSEYTRQMALFNAWLAWLGLSTIA